MEKTIEQIKKEIKDLQFELEHAEIENLLKNVSDRIAKVGGILQFGYMDKLKEISDQFAAKFNDYAWAKMVKVDEKPKYKTGEFFGDLFVYQVNETRVPLVGKCGCHKEYNYCVADFSTSTVKDVTEQWITDHWTDYLTKTGLI